jgi:hypothetical protein
LDAPGALENKRLRLVGVFFFFVVAIIIIVLIAAFVYFVLFGMILSGRGRQPRGDEPPRSTP